MILRTDGAHRGLRAAAQVLAQGLFDRRHNYPHAPCRTGRRLIGEAELEAAWRQAVAKAAPNA